MDEKICNARYTIFARNSCLRAFMGNYARKILAKFIFWTGFIFVAILAVPTAVLIVLLALIWVTTDRISTFLKH